jgi:pyruvate/oxaloacetate carboxyltransferase
VPASPLVHYKAVCLCDVHVVSMLRHTWYVIAAAYCGCRHTYILPAEDHQPFDVQVPCLVVDGGMMSDWLEKVRQQWMHAALY